MIPICTDFDLGRDGTRMYGSSDAERQRRTVEALLARFFHPNPAQRWELQLVADEVGMGKTFVALAAAYTIVHAIRNGSAPADLEDCAPRILVIAPHRTLAEKWNREVTEFVKRCFMPGANAEVSAWFRPTLQDRVDGLSAALCDQEGPAIVVTHMGVLTRQRKLQHYELKRRLLLGVLFRFWGNRFNHGARARLLKGAPESWPSRADDLTELEPADWERVGFKDEDQVLEALRRLDLQQRTAASSPDSETELDRLLSLCRDIAEPYKRGRAERFPKLEAVLNDTYRDVCLARLSAGIPLVVVDEAHHWRNGPKHNANGYGTFKNQLARLCRRALLLTATPFQLRPEELLELVTVGEHIAPSADAESNAQRRSRLRQYRESVVAPVLRKSAEQSRAFARSWSRLSHKHLPALQAAWSSPEITAARASLKDMARQVGALNSNQVKALVESVVEHQSVEVRDLLREALLLFAYNEDLSHELGTLVLRHRRRTDHRLVSVGNEYGNPSKHVVLRSDRHLLHGAPGLDVKGDAELSHYLLMRCVSEMKGGKGRSSLGSALTGCYSTLLHSSDGRKLQAELPPGSVGRRYFELLSSIVSEDQDAQHPKVASVVDSVLQSWRTGQKSLIFCFRTHTAKRLERIIDAAIEKDLEQRAARLHGGDESLQGLRRRLTSRDSELIVIGLDRVLWSLCWATHSDQGVALPRLDPREFELRDEELGTIAELAVRAGVNLDHERVDRVFLHRSIEHVLARRLAHELPACGRLMRTILEDMANERWVELAYGMDPTMPAGEDERIPELDDNEATAQHGGHDERGVHARYALSRAADPHVVTQLADYLRERRTRARRQDQISIFDSYAHASSFWLGRDPAIFLQAPDGRAGRTLAALHAHLLRSTRHGAELRWGERLRVLEALRRTISTRSILLRLLPDQLDLEHHGWAEALVDGFFEPLPGQHESFAERLTVYVEDFQSAGGEAWTGTGTRNALYEASRLRWTREKGVQNRSGNVALIAGDTEQSRRERVFAAFNSPLPPDVLICTSVGQEGIDLHRHCRNVVHYDLAWNPAVLEQRTGRVDRIGSKTFRERRLAGNGTQPFLDVGVPFLAGTYDERMYEELRIRAQTFEVLTGGDVSSDNLEGNDGAHGAEGSELGLSYPTLPHEMVADLRVRLHVWEPELESRDSARVVTRQAGLR